MQVAIRSCGALPAAVTVTDCLFVYTSRSVALPPCTQWPLSSGGLLSWLSAARRALQCWSICLVQKVAAADDDSCHHAEQLDHPARSGRHTHLCRLQRKRPQGTAAARRPGVHLPPPVGQSCQCTGEQTFRRVLRRLLGLEAPHMFLCALHMPPLCEAGLTACMQRWHSWTDV